VLADNPSQVDIYYFHAPDTTVPIEESLSAIDEIYKEGKFKRVRKFINSTR
jgi:aryl-alcohol dehydrogenase-like predicted oxidoreductase